MFIIIKIVSTYEYNSLLIGLVTKEKIIYKNWYQQTKYSVVGWPESVLFCNYSDLNTEDKKKVLNNLDNIHFQVNDLEQ